MRRASPARETFGSGWLSPPAASMALMLCGLGLVVSGTIHLAAWSFSDTAWEGALSLRKPALFGISGGLSLMSMGCLIPKLDRRDFDPLAAIALAVCMSLEVALITLQQWRCVPSHFNRSTWLDSTIDTANTSLIFVVTLALLYFACGAFTRFNGGADTKAAWRGGLAFLLVSCGIGWIILAYGIARSAAGLNPTVYGEGGVTKFPHGMAIHAVQVLPAVAWILNYVGVVIQDRVWVIRNLNVFFTLLLGYSLIQTLAGRGRGELTPLTCFILLAAAGFFIPLVYVVVAQGLNRLLPLSGPRRVNP